MCVCTAEGASPAIPSVDLAVVHWADIDPDSDLDVPERSQPVCDAVETGLRSVCTGSVDPMPFVEPLCSEVDSSAKTPCYRPRTLKVQLSDASTVGTLADLDSPPRQGEVEIESEASKVKVMSRGRGNVASGPCGKGKDKTKGKMKGISKGKAKGKDNGRGKAQGFCNWRQEWGHKKIECPSGLVLKKTDDTDNFCDFAIESPGSVVTRSSFLKKKQNGPIHR